MVVKVGDTVLINERLNKYIEKYDWKEDMKEFIGKTYEIKKVEDDAEYVEGCRFYIDNGDETSKWFVFEDCCEIVDLEIKENPTYKYLCKVTYQQTLGGKLSRYVVCNSMQEIEEFILEKEVGDLINIEVISYSPDTFEDKIVVLGG